MHIVDGLNILIRNIDSPDTNPINPKNTKPEPRGFVVIAAMMVYTKSFRVLLTDYYNNWIGYTLVNPTFSVTPAATLA